MTQPNDRLAELCGAGLPATNVLWERVFGFSQEGIRALRLFRLAYRDAWRAFKAGLQAVFPGGTLLTQRRYGVPCEPLDACWWQLATT